MDDCDRNGGNGGLGRAYGVAANDAELATMSVARRSDFVGGVRLFAQNGADDNCPAILLSHASCGAGAGILICWSTQTSVEDRVDLGDRTAHNRKLANHILSADDITCNLECTVEILGRPHTAFQDKV